MDTETAKIETIYIYPIKSCAGIAVESATLNQFGLINDRKWMLIDDRGKMITQRTRPSMVKIQPSFEQGQLILKHPDIASIHVQEDDIIRRKDVNIWADTVAAEQVAPYVSTWLQQALNSPDPVHLVRFDHTQIRRPGQIDRFGHTAKHFADAAPLLICNSDSLIALNALLTKRDIKAVDMRHFRPNIVVSGLKAFEEHAIRSLNLDQLRLELVDHCSRCVMITVDPETGEKRPKGTPFRELAELNAMPGQAKAPAFGVNTVLSSDIGSEHHVIKIGQDATIKR
jgi:uncharacterized protein YcbX